MSKIKEVTGDLIELARAGDFDVITHGCNCFCTMGAGIAVPMRVNFNCNNFPMEHPKHKGDINKLGTIDYQSQLICPVKRPLKIMGVEVLSPDYGGHPIIVVNSYTQYRYGREKRQVDYEALTLCMRKINALFPGKRIGLPKIGAVLGGGDWKIIKDIIERELQDMDVTIVYYNK
jgi:O-acetyl-ADP-ribose deacetylase (regulator of RNase III)